MSYEQAMRWHKAHPKGIRLPPQYPDSTPWPAGICELCGNAFSSENHKQGCGNPEYDLRPARAARATT